MHRTIFSRNPVRAVGVPLTVVATWGGDTFQLILPLTILTNKTNYHRGWEEDVRTIHS